jgi:hypothetical protein
MASTQDYRTYNVTAVYPDMDRARLGVEALEERGVESDDIFLEGAAAEEAASTGDTAQRDEALVAHGSQSVVRGVLVGGTVGALVGLVAGLLAFSANGSALLSSVIGGAIFGALLGIPFAFYTREKQSQAWEATLDDTPGTVVVGVHTDDPTAFETASAALSGTQPDRLQRFDSEGNRLPDA